MVEIAKVQHRHMIIACELQGQFEFVWKRKFRYNIQNGQAKKRIQIENVFHLVRTIAYVSRQTASCDERIFKNLKESNQTSHFYINRLMHEHSIAFLCTLFPDGIEKLLLEQNRSKNVLNWEEAAVRVRDRNRHLIWAVPIKMTGWKFLNCAIPLDRQFEPTEEETALYLSLYNGKKIYVKEGNGADREECCSLRCIREEMYILSPKQQSMMNQIKTVKNKLLRGESDGGVTSGSECASRLEGFSGRRRGSKSPDNSSGPAFKADQITSKRIHYGFITVQSTPLIGAQEHNLAGHQVR
ncbi:uncharacterized protein TNCV_3655031 [Trichonephila clavipes]|nr:uncharacterized protein TNCV_3655031 [Trichonephila clavipes]